MAVIVRNKMNSAKLPELLESSDAVEHIQPYDSVILDCKMPKINGIEVGKEILAVNPRQRIIFASTYPLSEKSLIEPIQEIKPDVEILQKPFTQQTLVDKVEDKEIYSESRPHAWITNNLIFSYR
jgi:response regulator RpfG family c-di-GMP phosphodiesterase